MRRLVWLALSFIMAAALAMPQGIQVAQVSGKVTDPSGLVIPGATVTIINTGTGLRRTVSSGAHGNFVLPDLPPGPYRLEVTQIGFRKYVRTGLVLQINTNPFLAIALELGTTQQTVEVQASAPAVETQSNAIGEVTSAAQIVDLPLNGRNVSQLVALSGVAAGIPENSAGQSLVSNKNYPGSAEFSVAGGQGGQTLFMLDGVANMDPVSNVGLPLPFPDALEEFKVETSSLPANYGNQPGGVVNIVTKSGSNQWHGDAFEFLRNYALNARNFFASTRDALKRNQFGGTLGGPILHNKLFFFGGYQGTRESTTYGGQHAYVPTAATLQGDFSAMESPACTNTANGVTLRGPFGQNGSAPNTVPVGSLNTVAMNLLKLIPVSTDPCGSLYFSIPSSDHENQFVGRTDYQLNSRDALFARYFFTDYEHAPVYNGDLLTITTDPSSGLSDRVQTLALGYTSTISATTLNSFRVGYSRSNIRRYTPTNVPTIQQLGANAVAPVPNYINVNVSGHFTVLCADCNPSPWLSNNWQMSDDLSLIRGPQQMAVGVNWIHTFLKGRGTFQSNGAYFFNGGVTGNALADLETGHVFLLLQSAGQTISDGLNQPSAYFQDNIRLSSRVNINAGVRWDPYLAPYNTLGQTSIFNMSWFNAGVQSKRFPNAPVGTLFSGDPGYPGQSYFRSRWGEFAPRIGVIWDPSGKGMESVRAGYGIFYGTIPLFQQVGTHAPFASPVTQVFPGGGLSDPYATYPGGDPFPVPSTFSAATKFNAFGGGLGNFRLNSKPTYVEQWNLALQRQLAHSWLVSATYLGNRTLHLELGQMDNPVEYIGGMCSAGQYGLKSAGPCSTSGNENYRRALYIANPTQGYYYGAVNQFGDGGIASYNGLVLSVEHQFSGNYSLTGNYTWSHCLDNAEIGLNGSGTPQNPNNARADYGNCSADHRHIFSLSMMVNSPVRGRGWGNDLLKNWTAAPILTASTDGHATLSDGTDPSLTGGGDRPNQVGNPQLATPSISEWFNRAAFAPVQITPGEVLSNPNQLWGNVGTGTIVGPSHWNLDLALWRSFPVREGQTVQVRVEAFNAFNHANFGDPGTTLNSPNFGVITSAKDPRIMQLAVKYMF